jgi:hypothetical protein
MPIDASIPLQVQSPKFMTPGDMLSLQNVARQGQLQKLQLHEAEQGQARKNALRQVMQGATDPNTGRLTPEGLSQITQLDPEMGLNLGRQQEQLRLQDLAINEKKDAIKKQVGMAYVTSYDRYLQQTGGNAKESERLAQQETLAAVEQMEKDGTLAQRGLDSAIVQRLKTLPPPEQMRAIVVSLGGRIEKPAAADSAIGKLEPKDYSPESWAKYIQTRDTTVLRKAETSKEGKPFQHRTRYAGDQEIQEEFDPSTNRWREIGRRDRVAQPREEKQPTDTEKLSAGYASRMLSSAEIMTGLEKQGIGKPEINESIARTIPGVGKMTANSAMSSDRQLYRQAQEDWVRAKLRKESGAVIADEEMDREIRVYFPQIGDGEKVVSQKASSRAIAEKAMEQSAGRAAVAKPQSGDLKAKVEGAGWSYEPAKYDYRITNGKVQRKLK